MNRQPLRWLAAAVVLSACGTDDAPFGLISGPQGRIRFVNLITDPARVPVNAVLEGLPFGVNLQYGNSTPSSLPAPSTALYSPILAGARQLVLRRTADTSVLVLSHSFIVNAGEDVTIFAAGGTGGANVLPFATVDNNTVVPTTGNARFRVTNAASTVGAVDVFVTAAGADLTTATPDVTNLGLNQGSFYFQKPAATYQIRFVPAGTAAAARNGAVAITIAATAYASGIGRTIVAANNATGAGAATGFVLTDR